MKKNLEKRLATNIRHGKPSLAMFLTAGYPSLDSTRDLFLALEDGGADVVEIGMPFSDPLADGPVIQLASAAALQNGVTLPRVLDCVREIRKRSSLPLVLMGYLNPILRYGEAQFLSDAAEAGVDGLILPELPLEEWRRVENRVSATDLAGILLVTPTTTPDRVQAIDEFSSGFLYCVSTTGVTGGVVPAHAISDIRRIKTHVRKNPMLVGFGISSPELAADFARVADGVIVGTALLRLLEHNPTARQITAWVKSFRSALDS